MTDRTNISIVDRCLAALGLGLIGLTGWAVQRMSATAGTARVTARTVLVVVSAIGWLADRLPRRDGRIARLGCHSSGQRLECS